MNRDQPDPNSHVKGLAMPDKSPRQTMVKKSGKSLKGEARRQARQGGGQGFVHRGTALCQEALRNHSFR